MSENPVLVIGGTRATGMHAVLALRKHGIAVRVLARDPVAARQRLGADVEIVRGDLNDQESLVSAFRDVSHLLFTAGVRSGRFARQSVVKATEYEGVLRTIAAARAQSFPGRFVYMTAIGVRRNSMFTAAVNIWKGNTLRWRRHAEDAIRASGFDYTIVRAAFLLNRPGQRRAVRVTQRESPLTLYECIARADVADSLVEALYHPRAARATFEVKWERGPRVGSWRELLANLAPD